MDELTEEEFECLYCATLQLPLTHWYDSPNEIWLVLVQKELVEMDIDEDGSVYALVPTELGRDALAEVSPLKRLTYCMENGFRFNAQILVDELSEEELPVALASDNEWVRKQALSRLRVLGC